MVDTEAERKRSKRELKRRIEDSGHKLSQTAKSMEAKAHASQTRKIEREAWVDKTHSVNRKTVDCLREAKAER